MKNDQWQLVNFGKYLSSLPVIWLSALKSNEMTAEYENQIAMLWLYSVVINTVYSFLWDVFMDWGLGRPRSSVGKPQWLFLRPVLAYQQPVYYYIIIAVDLALRGCWSLKLSSHLQVSTQTHYKFKSLAHMWMHTQQYGSQGQVFVLVFEVLEVLRRWAWIYFRVEWECICKKVPFTGPFLPHDKLTPRRIPDTTPTHSGGALPTFELAEK